MKVEITVTVSNDRNTCMKMATSSLVLPTDIDSVDSGVQKQDFLTQVEGMIRSVGENQIPALYAAVENVAANRDMEVPNEPVEESAAKKQINKKWKKVKKDKEAETADETTEAEPIEADGPEGEAQ